ncbi:sulfatase-like hydrolase/transferase [Anaerofilum sp. BX8]|uniref:Sulfatase-like hydrolase/transferase n=1 Tax=Anaerofilum hominis TaxID=2763016 RepID=A0A923L193_9FIRM|nr:sulfatase-like hydrolase/transferase [Anaerofilum hominis]MBC5581602.1 sulfatase-like hydrolase/transferase [Anaerofilum hominis]
MKRRPNILVFFTDQQRADSCGCYGSPNGLTPFLDSLGEDGVVFDNAVSCQPVCGPARAVIQTGQFATRNGCYRNAIDLPADGQTLARRMKAAGYKTGYVGKWHLAGTGVEPVPEELRAGYEDYWIAADLLEFSSGPESGFVFDKQNRKREFEKYRVDAITDYAVETLRAHDPAEPLFLFVSYLEPHHQNNQNRYVAPEGYAQRYQDAWVPDDLVALDKPDADWRANLPDYYGCIRRLDENLERLVGVLKERGMYEDTIIVFTCDHGSHFRTRNGEYKRSCHEASVHIPLVFRGGQFRGGRHARQAVSLVDLAPTLLDLAGAAPAEEMDGRSFAAMAGQDIPGWDEAVLIQISESEVARALRTPRYKYCVTAPHKNPWLDACSDLYVEECLYDLQQDPWELNNLIADPACRQVKEELRALLLEKIAASGEETPVILPLER